MYFFFWATFVFDFEKFLSAHNSRFVSLAKNPFSVSLRCFHLVMCGLRIFNFHKRREGKKKAGKICA